MEVIEKANYDSCITGNIKTDSENLHKSEGRTNNDSVSLPPFKLKEESEYVARNNVKDFCNDCGGHSQEKTIKVDEGVGNIENSQLGTENSNGLLHYRTSFKQIVESKIPFESRQFISEILEQIGELTNVEKLLLYLKLPKENGVTDPLKQPLNPLGNRLEISQTITWIKSHYEENPNVSIPKQVVYAEYMEYCNSNSIKPLSNADFGKVMKQVFSRVRPRRLGNRGNSRYCYSGMSTRRTLSTPVLPEIMPDQAQIGEIKEEELICETPQNVVCQWASEQLGCKFQDVTELAIYIQENNLVATKKQNELNSTVNTIAKQCERIDEILSLKEGETSLKRKENLPSSSDVKTKAVETSPKVTRRKRAKTTNNSSKEIISKSRKVMLKQNQNCNDLNKAVTDDCVSSVEDQSNTVCDNYDTVGVLVSNIIPPPESHDLIQPDGSTKLKDSLISFANQKKSSPKRRVKKGLGHSMADTSDLDLNLVKGVETGMEVSAVKNAGPVKQNDKSNTLGQTNKLPIPRLLKQKEVATNIIILPAVPPQIKPKQYKRIKPKPEKEHDQTKTDLEFSKKVLEPSDKILFEDLKHKPMCSEVSVGCLEKDALDDYLDGDGNSQEQEEELLKYFQQVGDTEIVSNTAPVKLEKPALLLPEDLINIDSKNELCIKTSSLRNLPGEFVSPEKCSTSSTIMTGCTAVESDENSQKFLLISQGNQNKSNIVLPSIINIQSGLSTRRRVSFENLPVQFSNDQRQVYGSFTPISPTDKIKRATSTESPFLSPKETSVSKLKTSLNLCNTSISPVSTNVSPAWCSNTPQPSSLQSSIVSSPSLSPGLRSRNISSNVKLPDNFKRFSPFIDHKKSPVQISSTSQSLFVTPCSPLPPCDSPACNSNKQHTSPNVPNKTLNKSGNYSEHTTSLLEQILLSGKPADYRALEESNILFVNVEDSLRSPKSSCSSGRVRSTDPLSQEVSQFFPEEDAQLPTSEFQPAFRSQSVPMVSSNPLVSMLSINQPTPSFFNSSSFGSSIPPTPVPSELIDFGGSFNTESSSSNFLLAPHRPDEHDDVSGFSEENHEQDNILLEPDIATNLKSIFDLMGDDCKSLLNSPENCTKNMQQISKSHPNTPLPSYYSSNNCNTEDPVVSAFLPNLTCQQNSRSYPATPVIPVSMPGFSDVITEFLANNSNNPDPNSDDNCETETTRNINSLIENSNLITEDDSLA